jgi:hypothetical protein
MITETAWAAGGVESLSLAARFLDCATHDPATHDSAPMILRQSTISAALNFRSIDPNDIH